MTRWTIRAGTLVALAAVILLAIFLPQAAARGWRTAFLTAAAPVIGACLMLAIARLTGTDWAGFGALALMAPVIAIAAIGIGIAQLSSPPPDPIAWWQHPLFVGIRAIVAAGLVWFAAGRLVRGTSQTVAAVALTLYAVSVTPIAFDWLLGGDPGHSVSAAGMILFAEQVGGTCAGAVLLGLGSERFQRDMARMMIAGALGLGYLVFMDFLILWYGDLPSRVGWYVARGTPDMALLVSIALTLGLFVPIAALAFGERRRLAGGSALTGLFLFNLWWSGGGVLAFVVAVAALCLLVGAFAVLTERRGAHA